MMRIFSLWFVFQITLLSCSVYAQPPKGKTIDPKIAEWYHSLFNGNGVNCCDESDGRETNARIDSDGNWEAWVDDRWEWYKGEPKWIKVDPDRILNRTDNPTGSAVLFLHTYYGDQSNVGHQICFVRPAES